MSLMPREEMKVEPLGLGYVRITLVLRASVSPFHVTGHEACKRITKFVLNFAAGMLPCCKNSLLAHVREMPDDDPTEDVLPPPITH